MLNVIAFGPGFFESIQGLSANQHRAIIRDLLSSKLVYIFHKNKPAETVLFSTVLNNLLCLDDVPFVDQAKDDTFDEQSILTWRQFFKSVYRDESNRLLPRNFYDFFEQNKGHANNIWMHPLDAAEFQLDSAFYKDLSFKEGIASDEFYSMLHSRRFSEAFSDNIAIDLLLAKIDNAILDLPSQFYKTIILFDKYLAYTLFKHQYEGNDTPKDKDIDGLVRFLRHLEKHPERSVTGILLIGEYPFQDGQLLRKNNTTLAFESLKERLSGNDILKGLRIEVMFVCPLDFPSVYHDRYCAWSSQALSHSNDDTRYFLDCFRLSFGNSRRLGFRAADFWIQGGRGFQVYEEIRKIDSYQHVTFDWASDIDKLEEDLFYRFLTWPKDDSRARQEWSRIDGHSYNHGFSKIFSMTL